MAAGVLPEDVYAYMVMKVITVKQPYVIQAVKMAELVLLPENVLVQKDSKGSFVRKQCVNQLVKMAENV